MKRLLFGLLLLASAARADVGRIDTECYLYDSNGRNIVEGDGTLYYNDLWAMSVCQLNQGFPTGLGQTLIYNYSNTGEQCGINGVESTIWWLRYYPDGRIVYFCFVRL